MAAITTFVEPVMAQTAHVLLPAAAFAETSGTYVNLEGRWQSFGGAALPPGAARPAWKILRVLGNLLDLSGFDYQSSEQGRDELQSAGTASAPRAGGNGSIPPLDGAIEALADMPMYQVDPLLRRAAPLQRTRIGQAPAVVYPP